MKKIVADCDIPYLNGVLEPFARVAYIKGMDICCADVVDADTLIVRTRTRCDRKLLENSTVKLIITATIGFDHIDIEYCQSAGIEVITAEGCNARGVLQWVAGVLAYASQTQKWKPAERTIGIVGVGHVGSLISEYAQMWGFKVICCDPPRQSAECNNFVSLDTIIERSDIISFHVPLRQSGEYSTYHMADSKFFAKIRKHTLVLNSSRGEVIDTEALKDAAINKFCSYAIDTWENEPNVDKVLLSQALIATTHIAGYSAQGKANGTSIAVDAIARRYDFDLHNWYPSNFVERIDACPIAWDRMCTTIKRHFDAEAETIRFKADPTQFETLRNNYQYRTEYF